MTYNKALDAIKAARKSLSEDTQNARSAWARGVAAYAWELLDTLYDAIERGTLEGDNLAHYEIVKAVLLNGAHDWNEYSEGGCALAYDSDIAERLCSPSELKKTRGGERNPNSRETWLDVQARALNQAARLAWKSVRDAAF